MTTMPEQPTNNTDTMFSALASYKNNALFTTLPHTADLSILDQEEIPDAKVTEIVLGLHIHEFIHQLHNFSTTAGLQLLTNRLTALQIFATGTNDNGHYIRQGATYKHINSDLLENFEKDYFRILGSTDQILQPGFLTDLDFETFSSIEQTEDPTDPCEIVGVQSNFKIGGKSSSIKINNIGYSMITEGIAYEIEKQVRRSITGETGIELDYSTPPVPYRLYRPLVEHLVGRECDLSELVKVGTIALQNKIPSHGLLASTSALRLGPLHFERFSHDMMIEFDGVVSEYQETIEQLEKTVFISNSLKIGLSVLNKVVTCALDKRKNDPFYELVFTTEPLDLKAFLRIITVGNFPPRCILQNKPDDTAEFFWIGSNVSDLSNTEIEAISTLQSALQFSQLHLSPNAGFNNTSKLPESPNDSSCPYIKVCPLKEQRADPRLCSTSPWMHDIGIQEGGVCWYVNGVKSLRNIKYLDYNGAYKKPSQG